MIGKELQMEVQKYTVITDRICLLSNILPSSEIPEKENPINTSLLIYNLTLRRKNKKLNRFNNVLHEQIHNKRNNPVANNNTEWDDTNTMGPLSRNMPHWDGEQIIASQTLDADNRDVLQPIDNETDLNKSNDPDK